MLRKNLNSLSTMRRGAVTKRTRTMLNRQNLINLLVPTPCRMSQNSLLSDPLLLLNLCCLHQVIILNFKQDFARLFRRKYVQVCIKLMAKFGLNIQTYHYLLRYWFIKSLLDQKTCKDSKTLRCMFNTQIWILCSIDQTKYIFLQEIELLVPAVGPVVNLPHDSKRQRKSIRSCSIRLTKKLLERIKLTWEFSTSTVPDCKLSETRLSRLSIIFHFRQLSPIRYQFWLYFLFVYYDSAYITLYKNNAWNFMKRVRNLFYYKVATFCVAKYSVFCNFIFDKILLYYPSRHYKEEALFTIVSLTFKPDLCHHSLIRYQ